MGGNNNLEILCVVRHAEYNPKTMDILEKEKGRMAHLGSSILEKIGNLENVTIFSSTSARAKQSAEALAFGLGYDPKNIIFKEELYTQDSSQYSKNEDGIHQLVCNARRAQNARAIILITHYEVTEGYPKRFTKEEFKIDKEFRATSKGSAYILDLKARTWSIYSVRDQNEEVCKIENSISSIDEEDHSQDLDPFIRSPPDELELENAPFDPFFGQDEMLDYQFGLMEPNIDLNSLKILEETPIPNDSYFDGIEETEFSNHCSYQNLEIPEGMNIEDEEISDYETSKVWDGSTNYEDWQLRPRLPELSYMEEIEDYELYAGRRDTEELYSKNKTPVPKTAKPIKKRRRHPNKRQLNLLE
ncbi:histidine phosphatase family protein [Candidatus Woesearchaeota archaeon]|nr:histidine phosphatase family protein [Candidatus Woesearchaeota archaeon]